MFRIALVIPTGIAAEIGGFAGDGGIIAKYLAGVADEVLTHPNVVNAASFNVMPDNTYYVEGHALDQFFAGEWGLKKAPQRIGIVIDRACEPYLSLIENAVNATAISTGIHVMGYTLTEKPLEISLFPGNYGYEGYSGEVLHLEQLSQACEKALSHGATALAVLTWMDVLPEGTSEAYEQQGGVDPIGAVEAMISHALTAQFKVPVAHSPIFAPHLVTHRLDPRVAAEEIGTTYLPCILMGLHRSPRLVDTNQGDFGVQDIHALVTPADACGGLSVLYALEQGIPVIAVQENQSVLEVTPQKMGWTHDAQHPIFTVANYWEAAGVLQALKMGIHPEVLRRPVQGAFRALNEKN